ncbi:MAG: adenosylcobalamin-dependent ribonucleoside-diphosphate reductase [Bdellovibrionota bacterium]
MLELTENAKTVLNSRYLKKDEAGAVRETPEQLFERVARSIAAPEAPKSRAQWEKRFLEIMTARRFVPNTPTLINSGAPKGQLSACFVLPVPDSLDGIFDTLKYAAKIHQSGGGTGFSFSELRPAGSIVRTTHGVASGPVSFMRIYDAATETIKQGGARRGANMGILRVDHPDIVEFIDAKRDGKAIANFNISVAITDEFMLAVHSGAEFALRHPKSKKEVRRVKARELFDRMAYAAWECGDPGLVFLDRINRFNPTPQIGEMASTNPCGEQPLLPYESCNLGSLNLGEYLHKSGFDWKLFRQDIHLSVRFLDNVIEANTFPVRQSGQITLRNRKIGLGVMGFADLLLLLGIPYDSEAGRVWGEKIMSFLDREAKKASQILAKERGPFPNWKGSIWQRLGYAPMRNATVSTVAPTGTISIIAGCSSGIEPIFSGIFFRNVLSGKRLKEVHPSVERVLRERGISHEGVTDAKLSELIGKAWRPAQSIAIEDHVKMQAVFQRHSDSSVSKTINLPEKATPADVSRAYFLAYQAGCKGITVYRDRSKPTQVLERAEAPSTEYCPSC